MKSIGPAVPQFVGMRVLACVLAYLVCGVVGIVVAATRMLWDGRCVIACMIPEYPGTFQSWRLRLYWL